MMVNMQELIEVLRAKYGAGAWTLKQILGELPIEVFPASTQFVFYGRGAMISLGRHLSGCADIEQVGKLHSGRALYRVKPRM